jgi:hypothetical protein
MDFASAPARDEGACDHPRALNRDSKVAADVLILPEIGALVLM